jgi:type II secretory ATPase GspE/PulE/Tfp pilus assembly ATPase PilB-like protein
MQQPKIFDGSESATAALAGMFRELVTRKTSGVEIVPSGNSGEVTYFTDGKIYTAAIFPQGLYKKVIDRLKILANSKSEENTAEQGSWEMEVLDKKTRIEALIVPTAAGEKIILKITYV